jgi:hypothetical protein
MKKKWPKRIRESESKNIDDDRDDGYYECE